MSSSPRIVSLIASATEIVCALGYQANLVGRSHECDFPAGIRDLPVCSEPRIDVHAGSREIDEQVKQSLRDALSIYHVFAEELNRLQPTHILTQTQCEVCAVSLKDVEQAVCRMIGSQPEIVSHQPMCLADLWRDIEQTAVALGDFRRGTQLVSLLKSRLEDIRTRRTGQPKPRVVCLEWLEPVMSAGNWVPELAEIAGGIPLLCRAGKHSPYFTWEELRAADPDVLVMMPCGFDIARTASELHVLQQQPVWAQLRAVRSGTVYVTDGSQYFNRPGPRLVDSAQILAEIFEDCQQAEPVASRKARSPGWLRLEEIASSTPNPGDGIDVC